MYIIEVIPIGRGVIPETLSYFSHTKYERGTLLEVPVRKHTIPALVTAVSDVFTMKTALRAATFSLRKLPQQEVTTKLSTAFITTAEKAADFHATTLNAVLFAMLPKEMREGTVPFVSTDTTTNEKLSSHDAKPRIFTASTRDRFNEYGRMVRESFATKKSIIFVLPTIEYLLQFKNTFGKGIEAYTVLLYSDLSAKELAYAYDTVAHTVHPLLIITTPQHAFVERSDIGTFVLEHARSSGYVGKTRPYLEYRLALQTYARLRSCVFIYADTIIRTEEIYLLEIGEAVPLIEIPKRLEVPGTLSIITQDPETNKDTPFRLLSPKLTHALDLALTQKKRIFLFSARRGLAPLITCIDCGYVVRDPESGAPLSLIRTMKGDTEIRTFVSTVSGYRMPAYDLCPLCGSWRLRERGIGVQQVFDEVEKNYPGETVILFDHQTAGTHKKASALRKKFYTTPGAILIGTALALPYLKDPVDVSAVISQDSLRAIPSWRQQEESFNILMLLREKTMGPVYVQTRTDDEVFEWARHGTVGAFYTQELSIRESFRYPPFVVFIHFAWREKTKGVGGMKKQLQELFEDSHISLYSAPHSDAEGLLHYGLMRIPRDAWPDVAIVAKIKTLPPSVRITINPDRIV